MYTETPGSVATSHELTDLHANWNHTFTSLVLLVLAIMLGMILTSWPISGPDYGVAGTRCAELSGKLDLNLAEWYELAQLPGIGESLARRIVEYREKAERPLRVRDLIAVKGIGRRTLERISPYLNALSD